MRHWLSLAAVLVLFVPPAAAQVTPYGGRRQAGFRQQPVRQTLKGEILAVTPRGLQVQLEDLAATAPIQPGNQGNQQQPTNRGVFIPLSARVALSASAEVADPALVLRPGAIVELRGELESPSGPISTGGLVVLMGRPLVRPGQPHPMRPNVSITPSQHPMDPATIWMRGRVVRVAPAVIVAAGRYRFPLRLTENPRVRVRVFGRDALALAKPGAEVSVTLEQTPRRTWDVVSISINLREVLTEEHFGGGKLKQAERKGRKKAARGRRGKAAKSEEKPKEKKD